VAAVRGYFEAFTERWPRVEDLAAAEDAEVMAAWAGLGYYSRARNLGRAAQRIVAEFAGRLPEDLETLQSLPGIGRSTAAAILALSHGRRHAILDGNVKRVLARCFGVEGAPSERSVERQLWMLAEECTPKTQVAAYTQAIMDLGATLCTPRKPDCDRCPLRHGCVAWRENRQHELPVARRRAVRPVREIVMLAARRGDGAVLLVRRPERGIWGGLWSLPEFDDAEAACAWAATRLERSVMEAQSPPPRRHAFTHFELAMQPLAARCSGHAGVMDGDEYLWYNRASPAAVGLPAPIKRLLETL
jgi:A/G-specific adenine glycosylase